MPNSSWTQLANTFIAFDNPMPEAALFHAESVLPVDLIHFLEVAAIHCVNLGPRAIAFER
jgi:hypothetical protein